jgi:hypothetical protein
LVAGGRAIPYGTDDVVLPCPGSIREASCRNEWMMDDG